ncbi:MAG: CHAT domain-containing protein [Cyanobacteria bacterium J06639_18]
MIEFVRFDTFDFQAIRAKGEVQWQCYRYLAFILPARQPDAVQMIDLGETKKIDELISKFRLQASDSNKQTLGWGKSKSKSSNLKLRIKQYDSSYAIELSKLLLAPILAKITQKTTTEKITNYKSLIIAADGDLNLVPFQILPMDETGECLLMDEYTVSYVGVGRDLIRSPMETMEVADPPIIIADPDFDLMDERQYKIEDKQDLHTDNPATVIAMLGSNPKPLIGNECVNSNQTEDKVKTIQNTNSNTSSTRSSDREFIDTLDVENLSRAPGTKFLGESVANKLKDARLYMGAEALETQLINGKCPKVMLIATHGLFLPDSEQVSNPMMRSALALGGANTWLSGGTLPENAGKGIGPALSRCCNFPQIIVF